MDQTQDQFLSAINDFTKQFIGKQKAFTKNSKIIHDPLWGTIKLEPWEVDLLDLPLFQRLRQIHQTSLVSYVFPGCSHTRFEHTLGVIQQAQRLIDAVNKHYDPTRQKYEQTCRRNLRLAALFHDCGHSCFSHISEEHYASCADMQAYRRANPEIIGHPHEIFSTLILKSEPIRQYLEALGKHHEVDFSVDDASMWITGLPADSDEKKYYETQVINGPFDADKLDYIFRDAHYSGIPVGLDLDRLWASCKIGETAERTKVLTLHQASVAPLEQILFSKISLFSVVYQHPKVRAAEKMFQAIIEDAKEDPDKYTFSASGRKLNLNRATDFLWLTDEVFFAEALSRNYDDPMHKSIHDIRYRRLLVRALTISNDTIDVENCEDGYLQLRKLNQRGVPTYQAKRELALEIINMAGLSAELKQRDVWVDLPTDPSFGEADRTYVRTSDDSLRKVSDLFPIHYWSELYQKYKWRGHVFCPEEYQQKIHEASVKVLSGKYGLKIRKSAGESAHVANPIAST